jgi:pyruvate/2-oxoglutarate dehydrogenase complex dihydrolipoamide dehydrogenase (E3) component
VALVEAERTGGDCLWTGCVPSKSLIASASLAQAMRTADHVGLEPVEPGIDFGRVMERVDRAIHAAGRPDEPSRLAERGIEVVHERGRFERPGLVVAGDRELPYRAAVIATGSRPAVPSVPGLEQGAWLTNDTVFSLRELPRRLAILGGGPIGVELGQAFARLGASVDIVETGARLLSGEEPEASELVAARLGEEGVTVHAGARVSRVAPGAGDGGTLVIERGDGAGTTVGYDRLLAATGREPSIEGLGLERVGVATDTAGWVRVDSRLRTTGDRILAAGDAVGAPFFTHVSGHQGVTAALNGLLRARRSFPSSGIPGVTFTEPEVARVGETEEEARQRLGKDPTIHRHDYAEIDRAIVAGATDGFVKLVADGRGRLLGATIVGAGAGGAIRDAARIVGSGGRLAELVGAIHPYPTYGEGPVMAASEWYLARARRVRPLTRPLLAALRTLDRPRW